jgi:hypothetical protein
VAKLNYMNKEKVKVPYKKTNIDQSKLFWNCLKCEYDLCNQCLIDLQGPFVVVPKSEVTAALNTIDGEERLTCHLGHVMA